MIKAKFGIEGLYDLRTAKKLKDFGLQVYVFDQRAKSTQFIQTHILIEILKSELLLNSKIVLKFDTDRSYMIDHVINKIISETTISKEQLEVWFYAQNEWIETAHLSFKVYYNRDISPQKALSSNRFTGFIFRAGDFDTPNSQMDQQKILLIMQLLKGRSYSHALSLSPYDSFPHALVDYLTIETFLLEVNSDVELCYRNLDFDKISKCLNMLIKEIKFQPF